MKVNGHEIKLGADLRWADLREADLRWADLRWADLREADLSEANLSGTCLSGTNLYGANLSGTCLDPANKANADVAGFVETCLGRIVGYRSQACPHIRGYRVGRIYGANFFSTADTECHPGLYLWPTLEMARNWSGPNAKLVKVVASPEHTHKAGSKWRTRWFEVMEVIS